MVTFSCGHDLTRFRNVFIFMLTISFLQYRNWNFCFVIVIRHAHANTHLTEIMSSYARDARVCIIFCISSSCISSHLSPTACHTHGGSCATHGGTLCASREEPLRRMPDSAFQISKKEQQPALQQLQRRPRVQSPGLPL